VFNKSSKDTAADIALTSQWKYKGRKLRGENKKPPIREAG